MRNNPFETNLVIVIQTETSNGMTLHRLTFVSILQSDNLKEQISKNKFYQIAIAGQRLSLFSLSACKMISINLSYCRMNSGNMRTFNIIANLIPKGVINDS